MFLLLSRYRVIFSILEFFMLRINRLVLFIPFILHAGIHMNQYVSKFCPKLLHDIHKAKLQEQISTRIYKNRTLAASDYCLHNQLKILNSIELWLGNSSNKQCERLLLSTNFMAKCEMVFVLTHEKSYWQRLYFKINRKKLGSFEKRHYGSLERFQ